jgi:hypothetical protein
MLNTSEEATRLIGELQNAWIDGLRRYDYSWLETHLADDFLFSAQPFPAMRLGKRDFIEMDKKIKNPQIRFVSLQAEPLAGLILSRTVADVKEEFTADLGPGMPSTAELQRAVSGQHLVYASAWRRNGAIWQCFDHHLVSVIAPTP